jgi:hypothetical protein
LKEEDYLPLADPALLQKEDLQVITFDAGRT